MIIELRNNGRTEFYVDKPRPIALTDLVAYLRYSMLGDKDYQQRVIKWADTGTTSVLEIPIYNGMDMWSINR